MKILLTGGLGYIGSHTAVEAIENGHDVIICDNLSNSKIEVVDKIYKITGKKVKFYEIDVCDISALEKVFKENKDIFAVIHFAGYKIAPESITEPLKYYENNLNSTFALLKCMKKYGCTNLIFSSSAAVYADSKVMPLEETFPLSATHPYGWTKYMNEQILKDYQHANPEFNVILLRYFNPVGAHESGLLGEDPNEIPTNLMPCLCRVAVGETDHLNIFGNDYDTKDGTCIRDFIHVVDLARGHIKSIDKIIAEPKLGVGIYNLGTGTGYSVLEMVNAFNKVNDNLVKFEFAPRRDGDIVVSFASAKKAEKELGFKATKTLEDMCKSSFEFQKKNR